MVVNLHTGEHFAHKVILWKKIPEWEINSESDFRAKLIQETNLVKKVAHVSSYSCRPYRTLTVEPALYCAI
jgi:hypothetical protein